MRCGRLGWVAGVLALTAGAAAADALPVFPDRPAEVRRDFALTESPDGKLRVFTRETADGLILMESRRTADGGWSTPTVASFSRPGVRDADPFFHPVKPLLLFMSVRPGPDRTAERTDFDIWQVAYGPDGWSVPEPVAGGLNTPAQEIYPSVDRDGVLYFASSDRPGGLGRNDIWRALPDGDGWRVEPLGAPVNTSGSDSNPMILPDGRTLVFFSDGHAGLGDVDLFVTRRDEAGWSVPVNLGPAVNTAGGEFAPGRSADGATLFFTRDNDLLSIAVAAVEALAKP